MTSRKLMLVEPDRAKDAIARAQQLAAVLQRIEENVAEAQRLLSPFLSSSSPGIGFLTFGDGSQPLQLHMRMAKDRPYRIGPGGWTYGDVVDAEIGASEFSLALVWKRIRDLIDTDSDRARDGLRQALDRDVRFERFRRESGDIWYRRVAANGASASKADASK